MHALIHLCMHSFFVFQSYISMCMHAFFLFNSQCVCMDFHLLSSILLFNGHACAHVCGQVKNFMLYAGGESQRAASLFVLLHYIYLCHWSLYKCLCYVYVYIMYICIGIYIYIYIYIAHRPTTLWKNPQRQGAHRRGSRDRRSGLLRPKVRIRKL